MKPYSENFGIERGARPLKRAKKSADATTVTSELVMNGDADEAVQMILDDDPEDTSSRQAPCKKSQSGDDANELTRAISDFVKVSVAFTAFLLIEYR